MLGEMGLLLVANYSDLHDDFVHKLMDYVCGDNLITDVSEDLADISNSVRYNRQRHTDYYPIFVHNYTIKNLINLCDDWNNKYEKKSIVNIIVFVNDWTNTDDIVSRLNDAHDRWKIRAQTQIIYIDESICKASTDSDGKNNDYERFIAIINRNKSEFEEMMDFIGHSLNNDFHAKLKFNDYKICDFIVGDNISIDLRYDHKQYRVKRYQYKKSSKFIRYKNTKCQILRIDSKALMSSLLYPNKLIDQYAYYTSKYTSLYCGPGKATFGKYIFDFLDIDKKYKDSIRSYDILSDLNYILKISISKTYNRSVKIDNDTFDLEKYKYEIYLSSIDLSIKQHDCLTNKNLRCMLDNLVKSNFMDEYEFEPLYKYYFKKENIYD